MAPTPPPDQMRRSTPLATCASRVQQLFDEDVEYELAQKLKKWFSGSPRDRRRLGDPGTIVLESELVAVLGARLRAERGAVVAFPATAREDSRISAAVSALQLLHSVFKAVHGGDAVAPADSSAQPKARKVLQALLRQA